MKKVLSVLLALCMVLCIVPMATYAAEDPSIFASGDGTSEASAYTIATLEQLEAFRESIDNGNNYKDKFVKLTADIDMLTKYGEGKGTWIPNTKAFSGTFDGDGHYINIYINGIYTQYTGLFGNLGKNGTIKNVGVGGIICTSNYHVGGIAGAVNGDTLIEGCYNTAFISSSGMNIGGIVGCGFGKSTIRNCYNAGTIIGYSSVGGILGSIQNGKITIENCYNIGSVSSTEEAPNVGAMIGFAANLTNPTMNNCYYLNTSCNKVIGHGSGSGTANALTLTWFKNQNRFGVFDFTNVWVLNESLGRPILQNNIEKGSDVNPYTISNLAELENFRDSVNNGNDYKDKFVKLTADIDMSTKYGEGKGEDGSNLSWTPIGVFDRTYDWDTEMDIDSAIARPFKGTFDGDGHVIYVYIYRDGITNDPTDPNRTYRGLFNYVAEGGTVKNLGIDGEIGGTIKGSSVACFNYGTVEGCYNAATVSAVRVDGFLANGSVSCSGVVYTNYGTVEGCYNIGTVNTLSGSIGESTGGVVAYNYIDGKVKNCYNSGVVSVAGDSGANGGVVGNNTRGTIEGCYNTGAFTDSYGARSGGVVGSNDAGLIKDCYNTGTISAAKDPATVIGGIVGTNYANSTVENCYNTGTVIGLKTFGGAVGDNRGTVTNCYYLDTACSTGIGTGKGTATALTLAQFREQSKFIGFDFTNVWVMESVFLGRPIFKANPELTINGNGETAATAFEIPDLHTLEIFRNTVNIGNEFAGKFFKVTADIDMSRKYGAGKASWTPIGNNNARFKGTFDGGEHVIKVYINTTADNQGLFAYVGNGGTVENLGVDGEISGGVNAAGIVALNDGTIKNCYNKAKVSGSGFVGGIAATVASGGSGTVEACYNTGAISSGNYAGGVVGHNLSETMKNCFNTGAVTGKASSGGIAGWNDKTIERCYNTGAISGVDESTNIGGIAGISQSAAVTNCYYLDTSAPKGIAGGIGTALEKSAAEFAGGEVAYLLQGTQTELLWGQALTGESKDTEPVYTSDWSKKVYKVGFLNVDGSAYKALYTNYNGTVTLPAEPTVDKGFKFDGWLVDGTETEFTETTVITQDINIKAQQVRNAFSVTYKDGMGGAIFADQSDSITFGESTPAFKGDLTNVTSYIFDGWDKTIASTVTEDVIYTAKWKNKAANMLILNGNGGTVGTSATVESTTDEKSLAIGENTFAMAGYHFTGWNTLANGEGTAYNSGDSVNFTAIHNAETVTLYAQWEENGDYSATFNYGAGLGTSNKGNIKWTDKVLNGITAPSNNGYEFDGWFCNGKEVTANTTYSELVANDTVKSITIEAKWTVKEDFTVIYNNLLAGMLSNTNVKWNDKVLDGIAEQKKDGYRFDGWFCDNKKVTENTTYAELAVKDTVKSIELIAKWTDIENPSISGIENGKTYCSAQTVTVADNGTIKSITVNGNAVQLDENMHFTLNPTAGEQKIIVTDADGNTATMTVTVNNGHTGGTATCCDKAVCGVCSTEYGVLNPENHIGEKVWLTDDENHEQKWDCCDEIVVEKEEHDYHWGICEECGYEHAHRIGFAIWSFLKNAVSLIVELVVGLVRFIKELNVFDFPCLR